MIFPIMFLAISLVVCFFLFQCLADFDIHWGLALAISSLPFIVTFFFGLLGLIGSTFLTAAIYKAGG